MLLNMSVAIARPKLEGNVAVGDGRQISFAEFGAPLFHLPQESHMAGLGRGEEILSVLMQIWDRNQRG
jgi:hypothetical protein